jgi:predicted MPP superfamily phosphohydrolase
MRSNPFLVTIIFSLIILTIDAYSYWGISKITSDLSLRIRRVIRLLYWIVPAFIIAGLILIFTFQKYIPGNRLLPYFHTVSGAFILFYVPKLVFIIFNIFDDVIFQIRKYITLKRNKPTESPGIGKSITRRKFLNQVGIVFAGVPFISLSYGILHGRFDYTLRKEILPFSNLPDPHHGMKIVQISDFHIGTFLHYPNQVEKLVELINSQNPDLILFTGDMVNNLATELDPFFNILNNLKARFGKYSILGNHDYGEYVPWKTQEEKEANLQRVIQIQRDLGFDLLLNESRKIELDGQQIELVGVENWGLPPFPQYGDLKKALSQVDENVFKILLSHDPTHWDAQIVNKTNIDLTLSGHTHGAQFGIEIPGWRWSPVAMRYEQWGGLYTKGRQHLYVNTGLGSIGYPGRVGMPPEITVFELRKA